MNTQPDNAVEGMRKNVLVLAQDALRLADLQGQLFIHDITEFWQRARYGVVFCIAGAAVVLGTVPVLLLAVSEYLRAHFQFSTEASHAIVGGAGLMLGLVLMLVCIRQLTKAGRSLQRSQAELQENINWLRSVLNREED